jgi:hypothetical protein
MHTPRGIDDALPSPLDIAGRPGRPADVADTCTKEMNALDLCELARWSAALAEAKVTWQAIQHIKKGANWVAGSLKNLIASLASLPRMATGCRRLSWYGTTGLPCTFDVWTSSGPPH